MSPEYISLFIDETRGHIQRWSDALLELERTGDTAELSAMFRAAHTIKGMAMAMGFRRIGAFTHRAENELERMRRGGVPAPPDWIDRLFDALRTLEGMVDTIEKQGIEPGTGPDAGGRSRRQGMVRVETGRVDDLLDAISELAIARARLEAAAAGSGRRELAEAVGQIGRLSDRLQDLGLSLRMVAAGTVFQRFPRMVRDLAKRLGKRVDFATAGEDTRLDRAVAEEIGGPLLHMLRNSLDHGIEPPAQRLLAGKSERGRITLRASAAEDHVLIEIEDDGRGISRAAVLQRAVELGLADPGAPPGDSGIDHFLFAPGFSTAAAVSDISGRGVGLDAVKAKIESLSGHIALTSREGQGARFTIRLPLKLAPIAGLLVDIAGDPYVISLSSIAGIAQLQDAARTDGREALPWRGRSVPLLHVSALLGRQPGGGREPFAVIAGRGDRQAALAVDRLLGHREVVVKPPADSLREAPFFSGITVLEDGGTALILDAGALIDAAFAIRDEDPL